MASKDLLDVVDFPTTYGFPGYKNYFPEKNSLIVDRQVNSGAIIIGKTNTAELGVGAHTANRLFGITPNIYGNSKSSGGSSGGAAVAVAANLLPFADGTDMMGSCRTPAALLIFMDLDPHQDLFLIIGQIIKKKIFQLFQHLVV